ncbi:NADH-quinone oxidoreductase subunit J [candidate division KSB1 bacterium]
MTGSDIIFLLFAALSVGSAGIVVFAKRITYAAFALMLSLLSIAALYVFLSADFLAAVQLILYVGGILILLLFGVLLTHKITSVKITTKSGQRILGTATAGALFAILVELIRRGNWRLLTEEDMYYLPKTAEIGEKLMTDYLLPFEVASILLLVALIGAMFIVRAESKSENK